jgi:hypothetical protein
MRRVRSEGRLVQRISGFLQGSDLRPAGRWRQPPLHKAVRSYVCPPCRAYVLEPDGVTVRGESAYGNPWTFDGRRAPCFAGPGLEPAPRRSTWKTFIRSHWDQLASTDTSNVEILTPRGLVSYTVLVVKRTCYLGHLYMGQGVNPVLRITGLTGLTGPPFRVLIGRMCHFSFQ